MQNKQETHLDIKVKKDSPKRKDDMPKLTSKVDKDGNYVFNHKQVNEVLKWAIKKSKS